MIGMIKTRCALKLQTMVLVVSGLLMGCSRGDEPLSLQLEVLQTARDAFREIYNPKTPPDLVLTRALLDTVTVPQLEVRFEVTDTRDFLVPSLQRTDDSEGNIEVWRTVDNLSFGFRDGMLVSTRGLAEVLLSAQVPAVADGRAGPAQSGGRRYEFRGGDHASTSLRLACEMSNLGSQQLEIVEQSYTVQHFSEACSGENIEIVNEYWVDAHSGRLWQSRQWTGPEAGYIWTRLLHFGLDSQRNTKLMLGQ